VVFVDHPRSVTDVLKIRLLVQKIMWFLYFGAFAQNCQFTPTFKDTVGVNVSDMTLFCSPNIRKNRPWATESKIGEARCDPSRWSNRLKSQDKDKTVKSHKGVIFYLLGVKHRYYWLVSTEIWVDFSVADWSPMQVSKWNFHRLRFHEGSNFSVSYWSRHGPYDVQR